MGGFFSTALDIAGSFVGDPGLGDQIASKARPGWVPITQTPDQIAKQVTPAVKAALAKGAAIDGSKLSPQAQQIAAGVAPNVAAALAAEGYAFAPGTVGAELQRPSILNAFGGAKAPWVMVGGLALAALLLVREI